MDRDELNVNNELNEEKVEEVVIDGTVTDEVIPEAKAPVEEPAVPQYNAMLKNEENPTDPALKNKNVFAILAMVLGIAALVFSCCFLLSIPCGVAALVFGILGLKSERRAMAIAGIVIGAISVVISVIAAISIIAAIIIENSASFYPSYGIHYSW